MDNTLRKAAEMALEYLEYLNELDIAGLDHEVHTNALRQALAQPEQEPVAWVKEGKERVGFGRIEERKYVQFDQTLPVGTKLYTAPPSKHWVSITNEQISSLKNLQGANRERTATEMAFAVDAKLKELNHG